MPRQFPPWRSSRVEDVKEAEPPLEFINASNALLGLLQRHHGEEGRFDIPPALLQRWEPKRTS